MKAFDELKFTHPFCNGLKEGIFGEFSEVISYVSRVKSYPIFFRHVSLNPVRIDTVELSATICSKVLGFTQHC